MTPPPPPNTSANGYGAGGGTNKGGATTFEDGNGKPVGNCMASSAHGKAPGSKPVPAC